LRIAIGTDNNSPWIGRGIGAILRQSINQCVSKHFICQY